MLLKQFLTFYILQPTFGLDYKSKKNIKKKKFIN